MCAVHCAVTRVSIYFFFSERVYICIVINVFLQKIKDEQAVMTTRSSVKSPHTYYDAMAKTMPDITCTRIAKTEVRIRQ